MFKDGITDSYYHVGYKFGCEGHGDKENPCTPGTQEYKDFEAGMNAGLDYYEERNSYV